MRFSCPVYGVHYTQSDFARKKGVKRQTVSQYFTGRKGLLTNTGKDLLEFLEVEIRLVARGEKDAQ
ncbi:helix-turn-helix transcriptional regulator [uncultured Meiothermus sp.]|uniref:helix-turn-helix domain-containing protein n=1 Tax=uncultured Meiothermus sp. TaxID=157471 RepID=UPI00260D4793|nr:helix-turn-helix transcriptional regulator [uncultured Meiothermus sp.]